MTDTTGGVPLFNLHGDAHLEQYAITDLGRGLTDFDDSSRGPAIVEQSDTTTLVLPGLTMSVDRYGQIVLGPAERK